MLSPLPRRSDWACCFAHSPQPYQPSPIALSGRPAHCPFRGLLGVHSRYGLHTRAVTVFRDTLIEGFSHFVTSMTAPIASGWSGCRVGLALTGKRRLFTEARLLPARTVEGVAISSGSTKHMTASCIPSAAYTDCFDHTLRAGGKMRMTEGGTSACHRMTRSSRHENRK